MTSSIAAAIVFSAQDFLTFSTVEFPTHFEKLFTGSHEFHRPELAFSSLPAGR
jgi:hypothetical protein